MTARFLALGDSYTIGEGVAPGDRWPMVVARGLRSAGLQIEDPNIIARTGWTTDELSSAIDAEAPTGVHGLVTLLIGVNDQYRGRPVEAYRPAFRALLSRAIGFADGVQGRVVVISIPDWGVTPFAAGRDAGAIGSAIDHYNAANRDETRRAGARYVDITPISRDPATRGLLAGDGLHPSGAMYALWAERISSAATAAVR